VAGKKIRRHPEVLAASCGEPRRMGHKRVRQSFEAPRKRAAPQDGGVGVAAPGRQHKFIRKFLPPPVGTG
jgi:hypothetical protein